MCAYWLQNLEYARDLLLGNPEWQTMKHMPANGLFSDRKANNFFNVSTTIEKEMLDILWTRSSLTLFLQKDSYESVVVFHSQTTTPKNNNNKTSP